MLRAKRVCSTAQQDNPWESYIDHSLLWGLHGRDNSRPGLHAPVVWFSAAKDLLPEPAAPFAKLLNVPGHQKGNISLTFGQLCFRCM